MIGITFRKLPLPCDVSETSVAQAVQLYIEEYLTEPKALLYSRGQCWEKMYRVEERFPAILFTCVETLPTNTWCVTGLEGMIWSEGA
jgi:hypothetical protein